MYYKKRPVIVQAWQFNASRVSDLAEAPDWLIEAISEDKVFARTEKDLSISALHIRTMDGEITAKKNDWIVMSVGGDLYPCTPDIFEKTFELATS